MLEFVDYQRFYPQPVIGVDEAGRGCLAGPVFAGAVILNFPEKFWDSKSLSPQKREELARNIKTRHLYGVGTASVEEIDTLNIHKASLLAMERAVKNLNVPKGHLLIDGKFTIQGLEEFSQTPLIKGDQRAYPIMAASIIAKTERDKLLKSFQKDYPEYRFEEHKGYATKKHKSAIKQYGPCPLHRKSFSGVREYIKAFRDPLQSIPNGKLESVQRNPSPAPMKQSVTKSPKGRRNEYLVSQYLKNRGWSIVCQNRRFFGVEVDILAKRKGIYSLIEVKSLRNEAHLEKILSDRQKNRLKAVAQALSSQMPGGLNFLLALVNPKEDIRFVEVE